MNTFPSTCLHGVSEKGSWDFFEIEDYLKHDSSGVNQEDCIGNMPLVAAVQDCECPVDVIKLLLRYGAEVNYVGHNGRTPLIYALEKARDEIVSLLLECGANVLHICMNRSALCFALKYGASKNVVQLLFDAGCPPDNCGKHGFALHCAIDNPSPTLCKDIVHLLIERGTNVSAINANGYSVMCYALYLGVDVPSIEMLCAAGVSLNACTKHASPLLCATDLPHVAHATPLTKKLIEFLLRKGAPLHKVDSYGLTPLQGALKSCKYEVDAILLLLQYFPDMSIVDNYNNNLLHLALGNNLYGCLPIIVKLLLKRGVCAHCVNADGVTALHLAAKNERCHSSVIELLLEEGAEVNVENSRGETPLDITANSWLHLVKMRVLFAAGARIRVIPDQQSLLERVLNKYEGLGHLGFFYFGHFKIVLQYSLLQNPNLNIESMIEGYKDYELFSKCWRGYVDEVQRMESVNVGEDCTLREFLNEYSNYKPEVEKYDCDQLLRVKATLMFPLFSNIISDKVDRCFLQAKVREIQVYTMKYNPDKACPEERVYLDYGSVWELVQYLMNDDLLMFIMAFGFMDCISRDSQANYFKEKKRCVEGFNEYLEQKKLASKSALQ